MSRRVRPLALVLALVATSCVDASDPTAPTFVEAPSFAKVSNGEIGGLPGFAFLPPIADGETAGTFDDGLLDLLAVEICRMDAGSCAQVVRTLDADGKGPARLRPGGGGYMVVWQTRHDDLDPAADYRIRVLASGSPIGWVDLDILDKGKDKAADGRVPVKNGSALPITFWIPVGLGVRSGPGGGTVELADGAVTLELPPGAVPEDVLLTATPAQLPADAPPFVAGTVWDFGPDGIVFDQPVTLTITYDPADLPPGTDESELRIHKFVDGEFVQQDAGVVDLENRTVSALVDGFSVFVLMERLFPGSPQDLDGPIVRLVEMFDPGTGTWGANAAVDVSAADQDIGMRLSVTDDISGVSDVTVYWIGPGGEQTRQACHVYDPRSPRPPDAGSDTNGQWLCPLPMPRYSEAGTWTVRNVLASDRVLNQRTYHRYTGSDGPLCDSRFPGGNCIAPEPTLTVTGSPTDVTAPTASALEVGLNAFPRDFGPTLTVDASSGPVGVVFRLDATDDLSGVGGDPTERYDGWFYGLQFSGPSGQGFGWFCRDQPTAGTSLNGSFECFATIPQGAEAGAWQVNSLRLTDRVGNGSSWESRFQDDGAGRLCNPAGVCIDQPTVEVLGTGDAEAPTLTSYAMSVTDNQVTVSVGAADIGTGVGRVWVSYRSQTSNQNQFCEAALVSGTAADGIWSCTITFPEFAALGEWHPSLSIQDRATNSRFYRRGASDGLLCYFDDTGTEVCQDVGETDVVLQ
ncbi:MAG: hypothetical protein RJQ04_20100 [Longimicrobiales bacterium]